MSEKVLRSGLFFGHFAGAVLIGLSAGGLAERVSLTAEVAATENVVSVRWRSAMGQPIVVTEKPTARPGVLRFETNRVLTGMAHERYRAGEDITGDRPPDELARRLFARGGVSAVHVYGNVVTVELSRNGTPEGIKQLIEDLYIYYREGVQPAIP
jgi:hypothetical protein